LIDFGKTLFDKLDNINASLVQISMLIESFGGNIGQEGSE